MHFRNQTPTSEITDPEDESAQTYTAIPHLVSHQARIMVLLVCNTFILENKDKTNILNSRAGWLQLTINLQLFFKVQALLQLQHSVSSSMAPRIPVAFFLIITALVSDLLMPPALACGGCTTAPRHKSRPPSSKKPPKNLPPYTSPPVVGPPALIPPPAEGGGLPGASAPPAKCSLDIVKLGLCLDVLGGLVHAVLGKPVENMCCPVLEGLLELEAAACLCTAIKLRVLSLDIYLPLALQLLITCGKDPPQGYLCPLN